MSTAPLVAITGAHGWVGRRLAAYFEAHGWRVRRLVRHPQPEAVECHEAAPFVLGQPVLPIALAGAQAVVHAAYDFTLLKPADLERVNVAGAQALWAAAEAAQVPQRVLISTMSAYPGARSLYGQTKLAMERDAQARGALVVRPGLVWGAEAGGMYGSLQRQVQGGRLLPLIGGGGQVLHLVHEEDLGALVFHYAAGGFPRPGEPVTAAHPAPWTFRQILEEIARRQGRPTPHFLPVPWRAVWLALKSAETLGLPLGFRSDSLVSLMHQNAVPDFTIPAGSGWQPRAYGATA